MTPEQLAAIKARAAAASDGPWRQCPCGKCGLVWQVSYADTPIATSDAHEPEGGGEPWPLEAIRANATFIAHAREDIPRLVADNERLRQALADYGGHSEGCSGQYGPSYRCRCGWRDEARALGIGVHEEGAS